MPRAPTTLGPPKISFSNWILGGDLVTPARRRPALTTPPSTPADAPEAAKPTINPKPMHRHSTRRRSRDHGTDTEHDAATASQTKEREIDAGRTAVPKDEVARKKEDAQNNLGWTSDQDAKLMALKKAGNSWKMIAQELGASKRGVVNRFKELCDLADSKGGDADGDDVFALGEMPGMFVEEDADVPRAASPGESRRGKGKGDAQKSEKTDGVRVDLAAAADDAAAGMKVLRPDAVWTVRDLEVLAEVEQRYRELKWMYVQAGFYNLTGRMVGAEIVRTKFEEG